MGTLWLDLRYGLRTLRRQPLYASIAILSLGLGIGATAAVFSVADAALIRSTPFRDDARLVRIYIVPKDGSQRISLAPETFLAIRDRQRSFESLVGQRFLNLTLTTPEGPERVVGTAVSRGWAATLGIQPILGRTFTPEEERAGQGAGVVLLSHGLWERLFAGDPGAVGRSLTLNGRPHAVIGVLPRGFRYPYETTLWLPVDLDHDAAGTWGLNVQARLKPGVGLQQARDDLAGIAAQLAEELPARHEGATLLPVPTREVLLGDQGRLVVALLAAVSFVLLIVCANLASLLLARSTARHREMAVRASLGAGRLRQVRQLLTESLLLATLAGALGFLLAYGASDLLGRLLPPRLQTVVGHVPVDARALAISVVLSLVTGLVFGLVPALRTTTANLSTTLSGGDRVSGSAGRFLGALVVGEIAVSTVLLVGAGLTLRNLYRLQRADLGYPARGLTLLSVPLDAPEYQAAERRVQLVRGVERELAAAPGVSAVGMTCLFPSSRGNFLARVEVEGRPLERAQQNLVNHRLVSPGFFEALQLPMLRGRPFLSTDGPGAEPVAIVSRAMAERYWPGLDPVGRRIRDLPANGEPSPWRRVVGVVPDLREFYEVAETWYLPYAQRAERRMAGRATFVVRAGADVPGLGASLRRAVGRVDPTLPVFDMLKVTQMHADTLSEQRFSTQLLSGFAGFGLLMAALGIYGVLSYSVSRRSREIGIRMALGARPVDIRHSVLARGAGLVAGGLGLGLLGALVLSRLLASLVTEVGALDPVTLSATTVILALVALQACWLPARRAMRADPVSVLRQE